jgi:hypothetical protein
MLNVAGDYIQFSVHSGSGLAGIGEAGMAMTPALNGAWLTKTVASAGYVKASTVSGTLSGIPVYSLVE